jgi:predicted  nucleic acid-binding Zn-ribbon protein
MTEKIVELLERYSDLHEMLEAILAQAQEQRDSVIPPEVKAAVQAIDEEFQPAISALESEIAETKRQIERLVLELGQTVKSTRAIAVYNKGRVTWDNQALEGYAVAHPEVLTFRREGEPYITIRHLLP